MKIGAQLYSVNQYTKTIEDFSETLKKIADIGYKYVQVSGTCKYDAHWLKEELDKDGLICTLTHYDMERMKTDTKAVIEEHKVFGCKYIGIGSMPNIFGDNAKPNEVWQQFTSDYLPAAKLMAENGCYFMYHNHDREFIPNEQGNICMDYLINAFSPVEMGFTLDTHWVKAAGHDPVQWLKKLSGRLPCVHYKDLITMPDGEKRFAPVGSGELDFDAIIKTSFDVGVEYAFVEQDKCYDEDPFKCLKQSFDYLHSVGLC